MEAPRNSIEFDQHYYATLDFAHPSEATIWAQEKTIKLLPHWSLAPALESIVKHVVAKHRWGTRKLVVENGHCYRTAACTKAGTLAATHFLEGSVDEGYKPCGPCRILIRISLWHFHREGHCVELGATLWADKRFCDCEVLCGEDVIPCHRVVLASCSPVFASMFISKMQEAEQRQIVIRDTEAKVVKAFLQFAYTGECPLDDTIAVPLLNLADYYQFDALFKQCLWFGLNHLTADNILYFTRSLQLLPEKDNLQSVRDELLAKVKDDDFFTQVFKSL